jgi:hypothetical protein
MAQQTAVEFLLSELDIIKLIEREKLTMAAEVVRQAKAMEKEQIENTFADGFVEGIETQKSGKQLLFPEQYYNETYNK